MPDNAGTAQVARRGAAVRSARAIAIRVAVGYALLATAWILFSGWFAFSLPKPLEGQVEIAKGLLFVATTSSILFVVIHRWAERYALEARHAEGAERVLRQVVETAPIGVLLASDDGSITFLNPAAEQLLCASSGDCVGRPLARMFADEDGRAVVGVAELMNSGSTDSLVIAPTNGEQQPRNVFASAAQIDPGVPGSGWVVAISDLTDTHRERGRYESLSRGYRVVSEVATLIARAHDERQLLTQLCEQAVKRGNFGGAWSAVFDAATGQMTTIAAVGLGEQARDAASRMTASVGRSSSWMPERLMEQEIFVSNNLAGDHLSPWSVAAAADGFGSSAAFAAGGPNSITASVTFLSNEPGYFDEDQVILLKLLRDQVSYALERIGLDRKRLEAEETLESSEETYRELFENHPQPLLVADRETRRYLATNKAAQKKYGYTAEEFKDLTIFDVRPPEERPQLEQIVKRERWESEDIGVWTHRDKAGRDFPVQLWVHTIDWFGRPADLVMVQEVATMS